MAEELPTNREVADRLRLIGDLLELEGAVRHRVLAYRRAADQIRSAARRASATQSAIVTPRIGTKGTTSAAPMRGCSPVWRVRSTSSTAVATAAIPTAPADDDQAAPLPVHAFRIVPADEVGRIDPGASSGATRSSDPERIPLDVPAVVGRRPRPPRMF